MFHWMAYFASVCLYMFLFPWMAYFDSVCLSILLFHWMAYFEPDTVCIVGPYIYLSVWCKYTQTKQTETNTQGQRQTVRDGDANYIMISRSIYVAHDADNQRHLLRKRTVVASQTSP